MSELDVQMVLLSITGVAATAFPFLYTWISPWWKTAWGRALVVSDVSLALLVDLALLSYWFDWSLSQHLITAVYALIALAAVLRVVALLSTRRVRNTPEPDTLLDAPPTRL